MMLLYRIVMMVLLLGILMPNRISAQEIRSRLISFEISSNDSLISPSKEINLDTCLKQEFAFWYAQSKVEVFLADFTDSLFSQTTTDSLGYFRVEIPNNEECYIKIEGANWQWGEKHLPLYIKNIKQKNSMVVPFFPYLRNISTLGEYVYVKQKRKLPFQKERWELVHNPPTMLDPYSSGKYTFRYNDYQCVLTKNNKGSEIDFPALAHDLVNFNEQKRTFQLASQGLLVREETFYERFPGGEVSFQEFIDKYRKSPQKVPKDTINYHVEVSCIINADGSLSYPVIVKSYNPWHDQEALRLIGVLPRLVPARSRDPVSRRIITIDFNFRYPR